MKKIQFIFVMFIIILCGFTTVYAANATVKFNGNSDVKAGEENTITIAISNSEAIGVIDGIITYDSSIEDVKISSSYNGWTTTYNETTGKFNAFNAEGTTNGDVVKITYKLSENALEGNITLKDISLTTISYNTINVENDITKTIKKASEIQTSPTPAEEIPTEGNDTVIPITQGTKTEATVTENNDTKLPQTGKPFSIITTVIIIIAIPTAIISYKKIKYYRGIK